MIQGGDRSRSRSSVVAAAFDEAIVETRPPTTGLASLASVQIAETPIVPAPMKRTWWRQMPSACAAKSAPAASGCRCVRIGTAPTHAIASPVSIATPTESPTRCPAPKRASDHATS